MDVLAGGDRLQADLDVGAGHGQVDDDLDLRIGEQLGDALHRHAELGAARLRRRAVDVGDGADLEDAGRRAPRLR